MNCWTSGLALARRRPALWVAWLAVLALPSMLALIPFDLSLASLIDLRPAAAGLVHAPTDDALYSELLRASPELGGSAIGGLIVSFMLGVPALWLLAGMIAAAALESYAPARVVAGRALGVAIVALPLRALPIMGAIALVVPAADALTLAAAAPWLAGAATVYALGGAAVGAVVDLARGAAIADVERGLFRALGAALGAVRRRPGLFVGLVALDLALLVALVASVAISRPLGIFGGGPLLVALAVLLLRAVGAVVGVAAAATAAASRSA